MMMMMIFMETRLKLDPDEGFDHSFGRVSFVEGFARVIKCPRMREWCQLHGFIYEKYWTSIGRASDLDLESEDNSSDEDLEVYLVDKATMARRKNRAQTALMAMLEAWDLRKFAVSAAPAASVTPAASTAPAAAVEEKKEEPAKESDEDVGFSLFD